MGKNEFQKYLSRRMMGPEGWMFFCRICGTYLPESNFYKSRGTYWGLDTKCKIHYTKKDIDDDPSMNYLKLNPITEQDFVDTQKLLMKLGYTFESDESIHQQFMKKWGLNNDTKTN
jgi:hypothetical protein